VDAAHPRRARSALVGPRNRVLCVFARLLVEQLLRLEQMAACGPRVRRPARDHAAAEVLGGHATVLERLLELDGGFLVEAGGGIEGVAHGGKSSGQWAGRSSAKRAYATLGSDVSSSTAAPCRDAASFTR